MLPHLNPRIRALAWIHIVLSGVCLAAGTALCVSLIPPKEVPWKDSPLLYVGPLFLLLAAMWLLPGLVGGWGLLHGRRWGRILIIIESVVLLLAFPLGTLLGVFGLVVLLKADLDPRAGAPALSPLPSSPQRGVLLAIAGVGAGFVVLLGAGFRLSGGANQPIGPLLFYGAVAVLAWVMGIAVKAIQSGQWPARSAQAAGGSRNSDHRQLVLSRRPPDRIEQQMPVPGSDAAATCPHLQPIEEAMRDEGVLIGVITPLQVRAYCVINQARLRQRFHLGGPLDYRELPGAGQYPLDGPAALIACDACHSAIETVHADAAVAETPGFPGSAKTGAHV